MLIFEQSKELSEDVAGGAPSLRRRHRQGVTLVVHACIERSVGVECGRSRFRLAVVEAVSLVFVTVVGPQVEVCDDLHLLGERFEDVLPEKRVPGRFDSFGVELGA